MDIFGARTGALIQDIRAVRSVHGVASTVVVGPAVRRPDGVPLRTARARHARIRRHRREMRWHMAVFHRSARRILLERIFHRVRASSREHQEQ